MEPPFFMVIKATTRSNTDTSLVWRTGPHASFHCFVENGVYPPDWAGNPELLDAAGFGE
jgi:hypothetical protein